jgi:hypothetical protein
MKQSDLNKLSDHLLARLAPTIDTAIAAKLNGAGVHAGTPVVAPMPTAEQAFADANPGIGGAPPEADTGDLDAVKLRVKEISDKLDALVQATGQGNSAAMTPFL